jgi:beta-mannosidase
MYTMKYGGNTSNLSRFAYFSQVMQAYALEMGIVSLRGSKPLCMGSLYWQLTDVWPVISWATVDYYGTYKIAQYRVR